MCEIFSHRKNVKSIAIASISGIPYDLKEYKLGDYIEIIQCNKELDQLYKPRVYDYLRVPFYNHYIVAFAEDERYGVFSPLKFENANDVTRSITIAQLSLVIYCKFSIYLGPIFGFAPSLGSPMTVRIISIPSYDGDYWEIEDVNYEQRNLNGPKSDLFALTLDDKVNQFFTKAAREYFEHTNKRWIISAYKYRAGINRAYARDALIDFTVALEALLQTDGDSVGYKLRLYTALLLGRSFSERKNIYDDINKFYTLRSKFVHGKTDAVRQSEVELIYKVGRYIADLLINTCGKNIESAILPEIDYMSLIGLPQYLRTQYSIRVTEDDIFSWYSQQYEEGEIVSHRFFIDNASEVDRGELNLEIVKKDGSMDIHECWMYLHEIDALKNIGRYKQIITKDRDNKYNIIIKSDI